MTNCIEIGEYKGTTTYVQNNPVNYIDPSGHKSQIGSFFENVANKVTNAVTSAVNTVANAVSGAVNTVTIAFAPFLATEGLSLVAEAGLSTLATNLFSAGVVGSSILSPLFGGATFAYTYQEGYPAEEVALYTGLGTYAGAVIGGALGISGSYLFKNFVPPLTQSEYDNYNNKRNEEYTPNSKTTLWGQERYVTEDGLNTVKQHLSGELADEFNDEMISRLESAYTNNTPISGADLDFYAHEIYEANIMSNGMNYEEAHEAAKAFYNATEFNLYHPEVIKANPQWFNNAWFEFWGIERN